MLDFRTGDIVRARGWPKDKTAHIMEFIQDGIGEYARLSDGSTWGIGALTKIRSPSQTQEPELP